MVSHRNTIILATALLTAAALAQQLKLPMTHEVYDKWKTIRQSTLSNDGKWLAYTFGPSVGDGEGRIVEVSGSRVISLERATGIRFSADSKFVLMTIVPTKADVDKAKKEKKKPEEQPKNKLSILDLETGKSVEVERLRSFRVPDKDSGWFSYQVEPKPPVEAKPAQPTPPPTPSTTPPQAESKKKKAQALGSDLFIRELQSAKQVIISDVADYTWSQDGTKVVYSVSAKDGKGDGVYVFYPKSGKKTAIAEGLANYKSLAIDESGTRIAFLSDAETYLKDESEYAVRLWTEKAGLQTIATNATKGVPEGWVIVDRGGVSFSKSGKRVMIETAPKPQPATKDDTPEEDKVGVDIWNWKDPLIQPMQQLQVAAERNRSYSAIIDVASGKLTQLETLDMPSVTISNERDGRYAIGQNSLAYRQEISWDSTYNDVYLVDLESGAKSKLLTHFGNSVSLSPTGRFAVWYDKSSGWTTYDCAAKASHIISRGANVSFVDETNDTPSDANPYGVAGWTPNDGSVWVYDRFDIWRMDPEGSQPPANLTGNGRKRGVRYRVLRMDSEERFVNENSTSLTTFDESSKDSGFAKLAKGSPVTLLSGPKQYGFSAKARDADVVLMTRRDFNEFPDLWTTNTSFANAVKRSDLGAQLEDYLWGTSEQVSWISSDGVPLQGILLKPENFDASKKYPMLVYFYEDLSSGLHSFTNPTPSSGSINFSFYVSRGYLVFMPDIPYRVGYPGESAMSAIIPGVHAVAARGYVDMKRIGIQGHSWGGYQVLYLVTHTTMFAAAEAGAPVSDMFSAYGGIRWSSGMSRQFQYEKTQSRIGGTIWDKPLQFLENSPIFWADKVTTPTLVLHNDKDGAVPWYQGIEFYSALRRLQKPVWLVVYNNEDHGIGRRPNQKDWAVRLQQFFDHYLLDTPAPKWMTDGVPAIDKGRETGLGIGGG